MSTELNFKVESFRKIPNPFQHKDLVKKPDEFYPQMYLSDINGFVCCNGFPVCKNKTIYDLLFFLSIQCVDD